MPTTYANIGARDAVKPSGFKPSSQRSLSPSYTPVQIRLSDSRLYSAYPLSPLLMLAMYRLLSIRSLSNIRAIRLILAFSRSLPLGLAAELYSPGSDDIFRNISSQPTVLTHSIFGVFLDKNSNSDKVIAIPPYTYPIIA